jgi:hypothetical protein
VTGLPGSTPEPYVLRKLSPAQLTPLIVLAVWLAFVEVAGFDFPLLVIGAAAAYAVFHAARDTERLRVDAEGVRVRPAARIPWAQLDAVSYEGPETIGLRLKPGAPLPTGIQGMIDGELVLGTRGAEIDRAELDRAVSAYSDAGGSFSGMPGSGASSSGMSAGGPSG